MCASFHCWFTICALANGTKAFVYVCIPIGINSATEEMADTIQQHNTGTQPHAANAVTVHDTVKVPTLPLHV